VQHVERRREPDGGHQCLGGAATTGEPGALLRGGGFDSLGPLAGPLNVFGYLAPSFADVNIGFRCAR
jgi:hypothetical protein